MTVLYKANVVRGAEWARLLRRARARRAVPALARDRRSRRGALSRGVGAAGRYRDELSQPRAGLLGRRRRRPVRRHQTSARTFRWSACWSPASRRPWSSTSPWRCSALHRDLLHFINQQKRAGLAGDPDHAGQTSPRRRDGARPARPRRARSPQGVRLSARGLESFAARDRGRHLLRGRGCVAGIPGATDILVCLLPLTDETRGILNADLFARLPRGAQGSSMSDVAAHLIEADLIAALDSGAAVGRGARRRRSRAVAHGPSVLEPSAHPADAAHRQHDEPGNGRRLRARHHRASSPRRRAAGTVDRTRGY